MCYCCGSLVFSHVCLRLMCLQFVPACFIITCSFVIFVMFSHRFLKHLQYCDMLLWQSHVCDGLDTFCYRTFCCVAGTWFGHVVYVFVRDWWLVHLSDIPEKRLAMCWVTCWIRCSLYGDMMGCVLSHWARFGTHWWLAWTHFLLLVWSGIRSCLDNMSSVMYWHVFVHVFWQVL